MENTKGHHFNFCLIDAQLGFLLTLIPRLLGYCILVETSPTDMFLKYHMPCFPFLERHLSSLLPRPSIGYILRADPLTILARKAELTAKEIQTYYDRFDEIIVLSGFQDRYIDVKTQTIASSRKQVLETLLAFQEKGLR